jgi:hypothetical protein
MGSGSHKVIAGVCVFSKKVRHVPLCIKKRSAVSFAKGLPKQKNRFGYMVLNCVNYMWYPLIRPEATKPQKLAMAYMLSSLRGKGGNHGFPRHPVKWVKGGIGPVKACDSPRAVTDVRNPAALVVFSRRIR